MIWPAFVDREVQPARSISSVVIQIPTVSIVGRWEFGCRRNFVASFCGRWYTRAKLGVDTPVAEDAPEGAR